MAAFRSRSSSASSASASSSSPSSPSSSSPSSSSSSSGWRHSSGRRHIDIELHARLATIRHANHEGFAVKLDGDLIAGVAAIGDDDGYLLRRALASTFIEAALSASLADAAFLATATALADAAALATALATAIAAPKFVFVAEDRCFLEITQVINAAATAVHS